MNSIAATFRQRNVRLLACAAATLAATVTVMVPVAGLVKPAAAATTTYKFQFGTAQSPVATGYKMDEGDAFLASRGYGWTTTGGAPLDMTWATRLRSTTDTLTRSNIQAYRDGAPVAWSLAVPDGSYAVTVSVGDANYLDSVDSVSVNGTSIIKAFKPTTAAPFHSGSANVTVTGGKLTLSTAGGTNTKINYITVGAPIVVATPTPTPTKSTTAPATTAPSTTAPSTTAPVTSAPASTTSAPTSSSAPSTTSTPAPVVTPTVTPTPVSPPPDATSPTHLAWFYNPPALTTDTGTVASKFNTFFLASTDANMKLVSTIKATQPTANLNEYFLLDQIIKPPAGAAEYHNNAAYNKGDFASLVANHPDWFLHDAAGNMVVEGGMYYRMDPGNAEWRAFWTSRVKAANVAWSGVFADNTDVSLCGQDKAGRVFPKYTTDAAYTDAIQGFLKYAWTTYFAPAGKNLTLNLTNPCSGGRDYTAKYTAYSTGVFHEGWFVDWHTGYLSANSWNAQLAAVEAESAAGGSSAMVSQGAQTDTARQQFAFSSYLLVQTSRDSFRYSVYTSNGYGAPWLYSNYDSKLGTAKGARYLLSDGTWRRDYTNGYVTVNPTTHASKIVVG